MLHRRRRLTKNRHRKPDGFVPIPEYMGRWSGNATLLADGLWALIAISGMKNCLPPDAAPMTKRCLLQPLDNDPVWRRRMLNDLSRSEKSIIILNLHAIGMVHREWSRFAQFQGVFRGHSLYVV